VDTKILLEHAGIKFGVVWNAWKCFPEDKDQAVVAF
jgi:hypothetical protein